MNRLAYSGRISCTDLADKNQHFHDFKTWSKWPINGLTSCWLAFLMLSLSWPLLALPGRTAGLLWGPHSAPHMSDEPRKFSAFLWKNLLRETRLLHLQSTPIPLLSVLSGVLMQLLTSEWYVMHKAMGFWHSFLRFVNPSFGQVNKSHALSDAEIVDL